MGTNYARLFSSNPGSPARTSVFGGIMQAADENDLKVTPNCYTPRAANFWIENGNLTVRNNYEALPGAPVAINGDPYAYKIKAMWVHAAATPILLAVCDAYKNGTHHHYCLLSCDYNTLTGWAVVKGSTGAHSLGNDADIWFSNADFSFANYSGAFESNAVVTYATVLTNGLDMPMYYTPAGLALLGLNGPQWLAVTANATTDVLTCDGSSGLAVNDTKIMLISRTQEYPPEVAPWTIYYVIQAAGGTSFKISATQGGVPINLSTTGNNLMARIVAVNSAWQNVSCNYKNDIFTQPSAAANDLLYEFSVINGGSLGKGMAAGMKYYTVNASGNTFQISATKGGTPLNITANSSNMLYRQPASSYADAPHGKDVIIFADRIWMRDGETLYYNSGYRADIAADGTQAEPYAHVHDWDTSNGRAGTIPIPSWLGDASQLLTFLNGRPWLVKENSVFAIDGAAPPFSIRQIFTAKGTISKRSLAHHITGGAFYATPEGILRFTGAATEPYLTVEIKKLWYSNNTGCICNVVGDTLFVYGLFYHPVSGALVNGLLMVDIPTKNICFQDMNMGSTALTMDCLMDPWFTTLKAGVDSPQHWFACGGQIYRYGVTKPGNGAAPLVYYFPATDFGLAAYMKHVSWLYVTGKGGTVKITPVVDSTEWTHTFTAEIPATTVGTVEISSAGVEGSSIGWKIENVGGDPIDIRNFEILYERSRN